MALTPSTMLPLGTQAPSFSLPDTENRRVSLEGYAGAPATLVAFICNHCPYVVHLKAHFAQLARDYQTKGVAIFAINANDAERYPDDSPEQMRLDRERYDYPFPYLIDAGQTVAKAYRAACTPDFFLFDDDLRLVYRGQYDDSRPGNGEPLTGKDLRAALDAVLTGHAVSAEQKPSMGCSIKWKPGQEPSYA